MKTYFVKVKIETTQDIHEAFRTFSRLYPDLDVQAIESIETYYNDKHVD